MIGKATGLTILLAIGVLGGAAAWLCAADAPPTRPTSAPATTRPSADVQAAARRVLQTPGLVAFWDFHQPAGQLRVSAVDPVHALEEMNGPIARVDDGPFGSAIRIKAGQWLRIPRQKLGKLDIHGPVAAVTVAAWIKRERKDPWQAIAGVWDESRRKRQYCLFLSAAAKTDFRTMTRTPSRDLFQGHVSAVGGPTPGNEVCITYASSGSPVPFDAWQCLVLTYDGKEVRLYRNGQFDAADGANPFPYADGLFDGGAEGADFTVGSVSVKNKPGNFFGGRIGGLAIFNRALSAKEVAALPGAAPDAPDAPEQ